ncbi:serine/threonine-protein kinase [Nocardioides marinisabuli]|nr:serine/threonine-protein kinase [Nocardioides marinisabuli]
MGRSFTCDGIAYELRKTVGGGGSGDVWLADADGQCWAVKILKVRGDQRRAERFDREASFQSGCGHDHIAPVVGRGVHEERPFYIMPFYPESLRDVIDRGQTDVETLLDYVQQIADALQFAHARGIAHRDVKPENVLINGASATLADFGIAHFADSTLTAASELIGNRDYRAPEQRRGQDARNVGQEADVYALGLIVNECFTREIPAGSSYRLIESSYPSLSYLDPIVASMLAQVPGNRPAVADFLTEIRFSRAMRMKEIGGIVEQFRLNDDGAHDGVDDIDAVFEQAGEDVWYAIRLIATKTPDEIRRYNGNWHMRLGYNADALLLNLCIQSRLFELCQRKFYYESNVYARDDLYTSLDPTSDPRHGFLYDQARTLVREHPLPRAHDLSGRILKTFASCADYHCEELLADARQIVSEVRENLLGAPILWIVKYLAMNVPSITGVGDVADHIQIDWGRSDTFANNSDNPELFLQPHYAMDPEAVLNSLTESWNVSVKKTGDEWWSVMFRSPGEYQRFRKHCLARATPQSLFEADVKDILRDVTVAGGITRITLNSSFDVCNTLAKVLGLRDI